MSRWGMVIDLKKCVTCYSCVLACKQEHFLPPNISWNRLMVGEVGEYPKAKKVTYPVLCAHCEDAECVNVCPTGASYKREGKRSGPPSGCLTLPHRKAGEDANEYGVLSAPD
jgi:molybdopterin-containing oxidoreductase family iron-sulfur binding subunit